MAVKAAGSLCSHWLAPGLVYQWVAISGSCLTLSKTKIYRSTSPHEEGDVDPCFNSLPDGVVAISLKTLRESVPLDSASGTRYSGRQTGSQRPTTGDQSAQTSLGLQVRAVRLFG